MHRTPALPRRYRVIEPLGQGGQGVVWLARDRNHGDREVAVKVVRWTEKDLPEKGLPEKGLPADELGGGASELSREFLTIRRLAHPNIARVRDFGLLSTPPHGGPSAPRGAYLTSDFVRGGNLLEWTSMPGAPETPDWGAFLALSFQALGVLDYLARRGIRHGDIKPANFLLGEDGLLKLIDFGTARLRAAQGRPTHGTPAYLPPRQIAEQFDPDLYALGMTLFHAAAGELPFRLGVEGELERWWDSHEPVRLQDHVPSAPSTLGELLRGLTSPNKGQRFHSPREALDFLRTRIGAPAASSSSVPELPAVHSYGYETLLPHLVETVGSRRGATRVQCIALPPGHDSSELLSLLCARLQAEGCLCVSLNGVDDASAIAQLRELTEELTGKSLAPTAPVESMVFECVSGLGARPMCVLIAHDARSLGESTGNALVPALLEQARALHGTVTLLAATRDVDAFAREASISATADLEIHGAEPLHEAAVRSAVGDCFCVDRVPEDLSRRITEESGGAPVLVEKALRTLVTAGVRADVFGRLRLPPELPARLVELAPVAKRIGLLPSALRLPLGLLAIAGEPLDPEQAWRRYMGLADSLDPAAGRLLPRDTASWHTALEALVRTGLVRSTRKDAPNPWGSVHAGTEPSHAEAMLYHPTEVQPCEVLDAAIVLAARRHMATFFDRESKALVAPATLGAAATNELALDRMERAVQWGLRALRAHRHSLQLREGARLASQILRRQQAFANTRPFLLFRLRAAEALSGCGAREDALAALSTGAPTTAPWFAWHGGHRKATLLEQGGDRLAAIATLEELAAAADEDARAPGSSPAALRQLQTRARLAPLYFAGGAAPSGQACLEDGRAFLRSLNGTPDGNAAGCARLLGLFAAVEARHGNPAEAIALLERARALAKSTRRPELEQGPLNELGILHASQQNWDSALRVFEETETFARTHSDRMGQLRAVFNRATAYYRLHDLDRAEVLFREARDLSESMGHHNLSAAVWLGLAGVLRERDRVLEALRLYRRVLRLSSRLKRPGDVAIARNNLAELYLAWGRPARALAQATRAQDIARETQNPFLEGVTLRVGARVLWALGDAPEARRLLERALQLASASADHRGMGAAYHHLGRVACGEGDEETAWKQLRLGTLHSRRASDRVHLQASTLSLLELLLARDRRKLARRLFRETRARDSWGRNRLMARFVALRADERWPENVDEARKLLQGVRQEGRTFEAFCALDATLRDPRLLGERRSELEFWRQEVAMDIVQDVPESHRDAFRLFWRLDSSTDSSRTGPAAQATTITETTDAKSLPTMSFLSAELDALLDVGRDTLPVEAILTPLLESLPVRTLGILNEHDQDASRHVFVGAAGTTRSPLARVDPRHVAQARSTAGVVTAPPFILARVPHPERARVVYAELSSPGDAPDATRQRFAESVDALGLLLRLRELHVALRQEKTGSTEAREEVRRLNALVTRGKTELETAVLTQRLELMDLKQALSLRRADTAPRRAPVGRSPAMQALLKRLPAVASRDFPVLILGESGVGKDLFARWIHELGPRGEKPYLSEICNLSESLAEAEMFGFVEGAFTGAVADRPGLFELASGGSIYLDEVADLSAQLQARLLRVLEEKRVRPIGANASIAVDFRLLSSSRRGLQELGELDSLRRDLLYRLNAEVLEIPPLRDRKEDIPLLVRHFLEEHARAHGVGVPYIHEKAYQQLLEHPWPGNVRELENVLERALAQNPVEITEGLLLPYPEAPARKDDASPAPLPTLREERLRGERALLRRALEACSGNASAAARQLGVTRRYLGTLLEKHSLRLSDFKH